MRELAINIVVAYGVISAASAALCNINTKKLNRSKQAIMPLFALVYFGVALWYLIKKGAAITTFITSITSWLNFDFSWDSLFSTVYYINLLLVSLYIIVKTVETGAVAVIFNKIKFPFITKIFYFEDDEYGEWFLYEKWVTLRKLFKNLVMVGIIVSGALLGTVKYLGKDHILYAFVFPTFVLIEIIEFYCFINGVTKKEYELSIHADSSISIHSSNFYAIREVLEKIFPHNLLTAATAVKRATSSSVLNLLETLNESDDEYDKLVSDFFMTSYMTVDYDVDSILATAKLMKGENVIFFNPFYRDLGKYIILPIINTLMSGRKCLVLVGRSTTKDDIEEWMRELIVDFSDLQSLWRIEQLSYKTPDCEIGVLNYSQLYDLHIIDSNREFFKEVGFVFATEPSLIVNTGQISLSILARQMENCGEKPVYCISDRLTDGLVDTMSHVFQTEITKVVAPPISRNRYTYMSWDADGDYLRQSLFGKQTQDLGNGTELAAVSIKNQIPEVTWYGETKVPLSDIRWMVGQSYDVLCKYMNIPVQQSSIYDRFKFRTNIWGAREEKEQFLIAEDEFSNIFSTVRAYLSRGKNQTFINVLSENYLLRDYMRYNPIMLSTNPGAVPSIVPDYAKTERNTLLKLLVEMGYRSVSEEEILDEFKIIGIEGTDVLYEINRLLKKYTRADESILSVESAEALGSGLLGEVSKYRVKSDRFDLYFGKTLKTAYYVCEDELSDDEYLDAKMIGHVTQTILPGQYVTYEGKYFIVKSISPVSGVILRRASNLFAGRKYYKQIRHYNISQPKYAKESTQQEIAELEKKRIISSKTIMDVELTQFFADFTVTTSSYLILNSNNDLRSARIMDLSKDPSAEMFNREYHNKVVLKIKLPDSDVRIRYTICMLLSEAMKSIMPSAWQYLAFSAKMPDDISGMLNYLVYDLSGDIDDDYIYVIEDSELDLGLLDIIEKNFVHLMEIVTDYLCWHFEKMKEKDPEDSKTVPPEVAFPDEYPGEKKKKGLIQKIKSLFKRKKPGKKDKPEKTDPTDSGENTEQAQGGQEGQPSNQTDLSDLSPKERKKALKEQKKEQKRLEKEKKRLEKEKKRQEKHKPKDNENTEGIVPPVYKPVTDGENTEGIVPPVYKPVSGGKNTENGTEQSNVQERKPTGDSLLDELTSDSIERIISNIKGDVPQAPISAKEPQAKADAGNEVTDISSMDGTDIFDDSTNVEDELLNAALEKTEIGKLAPTEYQKKCFLNFGFNEIDGRIGLESVRDYLTVRGFNNNFLTKARMRGAFNENELDMNAVNTCDFCGKPLTGVSLDKLADGRVRCDDCSASAIETEEEFRKLFRETLDTVRSFYHIDFKTTLTVRMMDAKKIAKGAGTVFTPSTGFAPRVLGYAQRKGKTFSVNIENGSPRLATIDTTVHEMTHIWQYLNWDEAEIRRKYPEDWQRDIVYEGMAMWSAIQYLYLIGEDDYAQLQESLALARTNDVYGIGFKMYCDRYPLIKDSSLVAYTPFNVFPPL